MKSFIVKNDGSEAFSELMKLCKANAVEVKTYGFEGFCVEVGNERDLSTQIVTPHEGIKILLSFTEEPPTFERGERILVRDFEEHVWNEKIFLAHIPGGKMPFVVVDGCADNEDVFMAGGKFHVSMYVYAKKLPPKVPLTIEQIAAKFGIEPEQVEIKTGQ